MKLTLTITITDEDAAKLWERVTEEPSETPKGQDLAEWAAEYAATTIESNWEFDAGVSPTVTGEAAA